MRKMMRIDRTAVVAAWLLLTLFAGIAAGVPADSASNEEAAIRQVVNEAYIDGIHNYRDPAAIRKGFDPGFEMLILKDDKLEKLALEAWIARLAEAKTPAPTRASGLRPTTAEFPVVEVAGTAAFCRVEVSRDGKRLFTDFLNLYKFADGWRIVGKSFYRWP
jgi:hypothetical protein